MDLGAYTQINDLEKIMKENNISVPRLRGLRLMKYEKPVSEEDILSNAKYSGLLHCEGAVESGFQYNPYSYSLDRNTYRLKHKYILYDKDNMPIDINWKAIHGKRRKLFKYNMKMAMRRETATYHIFNKYCGRDDVLYIHARIGGGNWPYYRHEVENQPWFIEKIDDAFDSTYCDIYAKISPIAKETTP